MQSDQAARENDAKAEHVMSPHRDHVTGAKVAALITPGVRVSRGPDWEYEPTHHQEGTVKASGTVNGNDWMLVQWDDGSTGEYRMGVFHKYDLQLAPSSWQLVCDHLTSNDITKQQISISDDRLHVSSFVQPLPDFLMCEMCDDVLINPHLTDCCDHSYCKSCISEVTSKRCPKCRKKFERLTADLQSARIISEQEIKCPYHKHKCSWTGFVEDIEKHLLACQYRPTECPYGCGKSYERRNMLIHVNLECELGLIKCQDCDKLMSLSEYTSHLNDDTSCPNGCAEPVSMETLEDHMTNCLLRKLKCKFAECGCAEDVMLNEMERHLNDAVHNHLNLLCDELVSVKQQTKQLEQQLMEERQARILLEKKVTELNEKLNKLFTN